MLIIDNNSNAVINKIVSGWMTATNRLKTWKAVSKTLRIYVLYKKILIFPQIATASHRLP